MTLRPAGSMGRNIDDETENRQKILKELGIKNYYRLKQVHSRNVFNAEEMDKKGTAEGDGLFTFRKSDVLVVTIADCMPVYFCSRSASVFGVLHSGWKGTGISIEAVNSIEKLTGDSPDDFEFILGPSIGPCCYEVDPERAAVFSNLYGSDSVIDKRYYLDLRKANISILEKKWIKNITVMENCTCCGENFYSFRGDGPEQFGLMLALIGYFR